MIDTTEDVRLAAIKSNPENIKFITEPSERIQLAAVRQDPKVLLYIDNASEKVQLVAERRSLHMYSFKDQDVSKVGEMNQSAFLMNPVQSSKMSNEKSINKDISLSL